MNVKGVAVSTTAKFIKAKFHEEGYQKWFNALPDEAKEIMQIPILASSWYPIYEAFALPTKTMCELFYNGDVRGAWDVGRYSAEFSLTGIYKMFVKMGTPAWLLDRAGKAFASYYDGAECELVKEGESNARLLITGLFEPTKMVANRISGWVEKAQEINGAKNIKIEVTRHEMGRNPLIEISGSWL